MTLHRLLTRYQIVLVNDKETCSQCLIHYDALVGKVNALGIFQAKIV